MANLYSWIHDLVGNHKSDKLAQQHEANLAKASKRYGKFGRSIRVLGPGVVTGAADDDPSGIATYSQAGAVYGYGLLWLFPIMFPLLLAVQESCARIGAVTGDGLATVLKKHYSKKVLYSAVILVVVANTVNIGSDLAAMAATTQLLFPEAPYIGLAIFFALLCVLLQIFVPYRTYAKILKWLAIVLFAYPVTAFIVGQPWTEVLTRTFVPNVTINKETIYIIVGILGTTISPYLFFWNTSEVVEDEVEEHRIKTSSGTGIPRISKAFIRKIRLDNIAGMSLASISAWFIVIACASTLHAHGITQIENANDAAAALEPLVQGFPHAGLIAKLLFSVGIIGIGLLAVPVLAGSSSYAISEALGIKEGLYRKFKKAHGFYELNESGEKRAFYGEPKNKSIVAFAGIYSSWEGPDGTVHDTYAILTTEPNQDMPDSRMRMPIIINPDDEARWLDPTVTDDGSIYVMLRPALSGSLNVYEVSPAVHSPKMNQPNLIKKLQK